MKTEQLKCTKPSVVMVVMGYNQQDYDDPMTIELSDDCLRDNTFHVMRQKAKTYQEIFHLILNRNKTDLGYSGNLLKATS